jgi:ElaB/YqjD/DUF883 family membrane-anchored ribosome-binding protein
MKTKYWIIIAVAFLAITIQSSQSQTGDKSQKKQIVKELRSEIHSYAKANILPELSKWKQQLDGSMSHEDLAKLNELRAKASEMRKQLREKMKDFWQGSQEEPEEGAEDAKGALHKEGMMDILTELKPIAEKYSDVLKDIGKKAKGFFPDWKDGIKEIVKNWKDQHQDELSSMKGFKAGRFMRNPFFSDDVNKKRAAARFMLWDGKDPMPENELNKFNEQAEVQNTGSIQGILTDIKASPNPFSEIITISFTNTRTADINLEIYDNSGKLIQEIFNGSLSKGSHSYNFNASKTGDGKLSPGTYYFKLTSNGKSFSDKIILNK